MTGQKEIHAEFLRCGVGPVRALARDERVDAFLRRLLDIRACATTDDTDLAGDHRPPGGQMHAATDHILDAGMEDLAIDLIHHAEPDGRAVMFQKRNPVPLEIQRIADEDIIPHARMSIQRQVGAVNGETILDGEAQLAVAGAGDGLQTAPEETMMHEQKIGAGFHGHGDGRLAGIHGGRDLGDFTFVFHLQAIHGIRVIPNLIDTEDTVEVLNEIGEFHGEDITPERAESQ